MAFKMKSGNKPGFKGMGSSPAKKELIGNQANLPEHLKAKIDAAPGKMYDSPGKMYDSPAKQKVDPDAPGTPGTPGYEPPVKRSDLDAKGKAIWDAKRAKKKKNATKNPRKQPTYEGTDEFRSLKDIPKKEIKKRVGKTTPAKHPHKQKMAHSSKGHATDSGLSVAEGGVAKPGSANYVAPKKKPNLKDNKDPMASKKKASKSPATQVGVTVKGKKSTTVRDGKKTRKEMKSAKKANTNAKTTAGKVKSSKDFYSSAF